jgi:hypothetical protein
VAARVVTSLNDKRLSAIRFADDEDLIGVLKNGTLHLPSERLQLAKSDHELAAIIALDATHILNKDETLTRRRANSNMNMFVHEALIRPGSRAAAFRWPCDIRSRAIEHVLATSRRAGFEPVGLLTYLERVSVQTRSRPEYSFPEVYMSLAEQVQFTRERMGASGFLLKRSLSEPSLAVQVVESGDSSSLEMLGTPLMSFRAGTPKATVTATARLLTSLFEAEPLVADVSLSPTHITIKGRKVVALSELQAPMSIDGLKKAVAAYTFRLDLATR